MNSRIATKRMESALMRTIAMVTPMETASADVPKMRMIALISMMVQAPRNRKAWPGMDVLRGHTVIVVCHA